MYRFKSIPEETYERILLGNGITNFAYRITEFISYKLEVVPLH